MRTFTVRTTARAEFVDITERVRRIVADSHVKYGICVVTVPHTTAGITINENADPSVVRDMIYALDTLVPWESPHYHHVEGNTAAHVKSSLMGHSVQVLVRDEKLQLGQWQGIYFCEFDGPRTREVMVQITTSTTL
jgi:secondary thiamine-phosphate synthase enzyme